MTRQIVMIRLVIKGMLKITWLNNIRWTCGLCMRYGYVRTWVLYKANGVTNCVIFFIMCAECFVLLFRVVIKSIN